MTLMGKSNPLGGAVCAYTPGTILFDGSNGDSATLQMKKGFYFIRGQGAGAGGGNCGLYGTGGGGGSGAGFEGNVYITDNQNDVNCYAGIAEEANRKDGEASYIGGLMNMGGGHIGGSDNGVAGTGGTLTISGNILVISCRVSSDGNPGNQTTGSNGTKGGANSVLTNSGAGIANAAFAERCATAPGAGGAGGRQWDGNGGYGKYGELKIQYLKPKP